MTKIYLCSFRRCSVPLENGKSVMFEDRSYGEFGSIYTTTNKEEQEMLERSPLFGKIFILRETIGADEPKQEKKHATNATNEQKQTVEFADVKRIQDVIGIIKRICSERGLEYSVIRSREKALQKASELGLSFPNLQ